MTKKDIYIYGAGGLGREVLSMLRVMPEWNVAGFVDDTLSSGAQVLGINVKGGRSFLQAAQQTVYVVLALGNPSVKRSITEAISNGRVEFPVLVHPTAVIQDPATISIGDGSIIGAGAILTTGISIGTQVLININTTVGHDCIIGNYCSLMPGSNIAGEVTIGEGVLIGSGANILNRVRLEKDCVVGMGSVVIRDVKSNATVAGVPARPISK